FAYNENFVAIGEESAAGRSNGSCAVAKGIYGKHQRRSHDLRWRRGCILIRWLLFSLNESDRRSGVEDVSPSALIFRFPGIFQLPPMQLGIVHSKRRIVLNECRGVCDHCRISGTEMPDDSRYQQQHEKRSDLPFLIHQAARKKALTCKFTRIAPATPCD